MIILGIETSCDDTGLALFDTNKGLLAHSVYSQRVHDKFNGVVPELASRDHTRVLPSLLQKLLSDNNLAFKDLGLIAYTYGPGLIGSLLTGVAFAKSLAFGLGIDSVRVDHIEGHIWAPFVDNLKIKQEPFISLLVSGGHTMLIAVYDFANYKIIGETLDDAVGEAFDKVAKLLGLGYPGGPALSALAKSYVITNGVQPLELPTPLIKYRNSSEHRFNFSFSGIKSHMHRLIQSNQYAADYLAWSFESKIADLLLEKTMWAVKQTGINKIVVAGGVSANSKIREKLMSLADVEVLFPALDLCTDNGAMIAYVGYQRYLRGKIDHDLDIYATSRIRVDSHI